MLDVLMYVVQEWSYLRGGLSTLDRDYGIFNKIHHDIGTHVVHHLLPQIPHYNLCEATEAVKPVMGEYYRCGIGPLTVWVCCCSRRPKIITSQSVTAACLHHGSYMCVKLCITGYIWIVQGARDVKGPSSLPPGAATGPQPVVRPLCRRRGQHRVLSEGPQILVSVPTAACTSASVTGFITLPLSTLMMMSLMVLQVHSSSANLRQEGDSASQLVKQRHPAAAGRPGIMRALVASSQTALAARRQRKKP